MAKQIQCVNNMKNWKFIIKILKINHKKNKKMPEYNTNNFVWNKNAQLYLLKKKSVKAKKKQVQI